MNRFSWVSSIGKGITATLFWFMAPLKAVSLILDIACSAIFLGSIAYIAAIFLGYIPDNQVNSLLNMVGHKIEHHVIPDDIFKSDRATTQLHTPQP